MEKLVFKYAEWKNILEAQLENRPRQQHLEHFSHYLVEFEHQCFDEVEVPGQYLMLRDSNSDFIRIGRFQPTIDFCRSNGGWHRRITLSGHDGSMHSFKIQNPSGRNSRREERIIQLFRIMNSALEKKKESRQRSLHFHLPAIIPLAPNVRIIQDDSSYVSFHDMLDDHCARKGFRKDEPLLHYMESMKKTIAEKGSAFSEDTSEQLSLKIELVEGVSSAIVPDTVISNVGALFHVCLISVVLVSLHVFLL